MAQGKTTIKEIDYIVDFGIHRGKTIETILNVEPQYLWWMHNKTNYTFGKRLLKSHPELDQVVSCETFKR